MQLPGHPLPLLTKDAAMKSLLYRFLAFARNDTLRVLIKMIFVLDEAESPYGCFIYYAKSFDKR